MKPIACPVCHNVTYPGPSSLSCWCPSCGASLESPLVITPKDRLWLALAVIVGAIGGVVVGMCGGGM